MTQYEQYQKTVKSVEYNGEIIPYYTTICGNVILMTEPRNTTDEAILYELILKQNKYLKSHN